MERIDHSFSRQGFMKTLDAEIESVEQGILRSTYDGACAPGDSVGERLILAGAL